MMRRLSLCVGAVALLTFGAPSRVSAQQSLNFYLGGFLPHGSSCDSSTQGGQSACLRDARGINDVLFANTVDALHTPDAIDFDMKSFKGVTAGAEYLVGLGDLLDAGLGVGIYSRTVPASYTGLVNANGSDIQQDLKLRIIPFTATIRFLPLGHHDAVTPYVGGGVAIYRWQYIEAGDFVGSQNQIFHDQFFSCRQSLADTSPCGKTNVGPVVLGGLRIPVGKVGFGFEYRYQGGEGDLQASETFAGQKINLGGHNVLFTINVEF